MPDVLLIVMATCSMMIILFGFLIENWSKKLFIIPVVLTIWLVLALSAPYKETKIRYNVINIDNSQYVKKNDDFININEMYGITVPQGKNIVVKQYNSWAYGVYRVITQDEITVE